MTVLDSSSRAVLKATHTGIELSGVDSERLGRALEKSAFMTSVSLRDGETTAVARATGSALSDENIRALEQFEPEQLAKAPPDRTALTHITASELVDFGRALVVAREAAVATAGAPMAARAGGGPAAAQ